MDTFHLSAVKEAPGSILATVAPSRGVLVTMLGKLPHCEGQKEQPPLPSFVPSSPRGVNDSLT